MPNHGWIVSILEDVACYAEKNNLEKLKETLRAAQAVAIVETGCDIVNFPEPERPKLQVVK